MKCVLFIAKNYIHHSIQTLKNWFIILLILINTKVINISFHQAQYSTKSFQIVQ